jgi:WD40 repeat protein
LYRFDNTVKRQAMRRVEENVLDLSFSADSQSLLVASGDRLRFWETSTWKVRLTIHGDMTYKQVPSPDGKKIASTNKDRDIHWLNAATGEALPSWAGCTNRVDALAFSRDGRTMVTGDREAIRVWDTATGKVILQPDGPSQICYSLAFSADSKTLLAGSKTDLHFLDGRTLVERSRVSPAMPRDDASDWRQSADLAPDGSLAATLGAKDEILLIDPREKKIVRTLRHPGWLPKRIAFGPDSKTIYGSGSGDQGLRAWNVETGAMSHPLEKDFPPRNNITPTPSEEKLTTVWDLVKKVERKTEKLGNIAGRLTASTLSVDGRLLVTGHDDGAIITWDIAAGRKIATVRPDPSGVIALACSPDGKGLVSSSCSCTVFRWDAEAWKGR